MTKQEIDKMAGDMAIDFERQYGARGDGLKDTARMWLMAAIRETEDEAKAVAYDLVAAIGSKRKSS